MSALLVAKGNIFAMYSQYAEINCEGNVRIENQLMHNIVKVTGHLWVGKEDKANGKLIGGYIHAGQYVSSGIIGATAGSKTIISFDKKVDHFKENIAEIEGRLQEESTKAQELQALAKKMKDLPKKSLTLKCLPKLFLPINITPKIWPESLEKKNWLSKSYKSTWPVFYVVGTERLYHGVEMRVGDFHERTKREYGPSKLIYSERKVHIEPLVNT